MQHTPSASTAGGDAMRFATEAHGFEAWNEAFARKVARVEITATDPARFRPDIRSRPFPCGVTFSHNGFGACSMTRTLEFLRDGDDAVTFVYCLNGQFKIRFGDDRASLAAGQAALLPHCRLGGGAFVGDGSRTYTLRLEHDAARALLPKLEPATLRVIRPAGPELTLLRMYCDLLMSQQELPVALACSAGDHLGELVSHACGGATQITSGRGVRAARLMGIKDDIAALLNHEDFSSGMIAARHRVTPRYIQSLFDSEGLTFTEYVRDVRLAHAHRMLTNPRHAGRKISTIAYDAGFGDLTYFIRAFRRRYGLLPSDVRAATRP